MGCLIVLARFSGSIGHFQTWVPEWNPPGPCDILAGVGYNKRFLPWPTSTPLEVVTKYKERVTRTRWLIIIRVKCMSQPQPPEKLFRTTFFTSVHTLLGISTHIAGLERIFEYSNIRLSANSRISGTNIREYRARDFNPNSDWYLSADANLVLFSPVQLPPKSSESP